MTDAEYKQICAVLDSIASGQIPPAITAVSLPAGSGPDRFAEAIKSREVWPPLNTPLVSREQVKKLLAFWVTDPEDAT